ncbi:hypothetical protein KGD83_09455 [Nocardiopsis akebiae]|uniref:Uncharacterized protein n=1 Tax=Nocardiopsis akebiae TaxID=2831968 RepID=A0ABX8C8G6_9ACTN|nr:hypothetical protein [Nocardiopsis akebiae]QUX30692.1 hypothetical protein KGD83_09455 [Nocardiopsis akebiae]
MNTSREDTNPADDAASPEATAEAAETTEAAPTARASAEEAPEAGTAGRNGSTGVADAAGPPQEAGAREARRESDASGAFIAGAPVRTPSGLFAAETFSVIALMLFALTALNTRLFELFGFFFVGRVPTDTSAGEASALAAEVMVAGGLSALTVLAGALSLLRGGAATRAWSRWGAAAAVIVGTLLVVVSVLTFATLPSGS